MSVIVLVPTTAQTNAQNMNYTVVLLPGVLILPWSVLLPRILWLTFILGPRSERGWGYNAGVSDTARC